MTSKVWVMLMVLSFRLTWQVYLPSSAMVTLRRRTSTPDDPCWPRGSTCNLGSSRILRDPALMILSPRYQVITDEPRRIKSNILAFRCLNVYFILSLWFLFPARIIPPRAMNWTEELFDSRLSNFGLETLMPLLPPPPSTTLNIECKWPNLPSQQTAAAVASRLHTVEQTNYCKLVCWITQAWLFTLALLRCFVMHRKRLASNIYGTNSSEEREKCFFSWK